MERPAVAEPVIPRGVEVAVVGAGPAGSATACRLARAGRRVALLEGTCFEAPRVGESLAPEVQPLLKDLGVWEAFLETAPVPSFGMRAMWGDALGRVHSHVTSPWGSGWHVDRVAFDRMLADAAAAAGASLLTGTKCLRCEESLDGWTLILERRAAGGGPAAPFRLRARMVVDASGRAARLAPWVGAIRVSFDHLVAIATWFDRADANDGGYVMVESIPEGWWYSAPTPGPRMVATLMTDGDLCARGAFDSRTVWQRLLRATLTMHERIGRGAVGGKPRVFSAVSQRLRRRERRRPWLAVGDAALAVDPLSGSGVIRAINMARAASETVLSELIAPGHGAIGDYERARDGECIEYLGELGACYAIERRWPSQPFWQRRAAWTAKAAAGQPLAV